MKIARSSTRQARRSPKQAEAGPDAAESTATESTTTELTTTELTVAPAIPGDDGAGIDPATGMETTREQRIAIIAYYKAERRGFANSGELDDWLEAEREVDDPQGPEQSAR